ncbi:hypothetical protein EDC94DRAFT_609741 [Helicostylum pulchrum]|nr:hypothetical protein EDC94DRAFT_609741 [Helicostylum pulchrum]
MSQQQTSQPLRLRNPTNYHLMASGQQPYHPLTDIEAQHISQHQQQQFGIHNRSPPTDQVEFNDSFSQNIMANMSATSPLHEYQDDQDFNNQTIYDHKSSFSSTSNGLNTIPMDIHRRSSTATDTTLQSLQGRNHHPNQQHQHQQQQQQQQQQEASLYGNQPVFIPGSSLDSTQSLAMSAPANIGYEYGYPANNVPLDNGSTGSANNSTNMARSFEDDYTVQMNMQLMMEKRRRRRESHNAGNIFFFFTYIYYFGLVKKN